MKRLGPARDRLLMDDGSASFVWPFTQPNHTVLHGLATVSYNAGATTAFRLNAIGSGAGGGSRSDVALSTGEANGSLVFRGVWTAASPSLLHSALRTSWSLMFWTRLNGTTAATFSLIEYSYGPSPAQPWETSLLGVYTDQGTGLLAIRWDISTSTAQIINTPVTLSGTGDHFGLVRENDSLEVWKNGKLAYTASSLFYPNNAASGNSSNWALGGSYRYGLSTTTAALVSGTTSGEDVNLADVAFYPRPLKAAKIRESYGNALRPWDERELIESGTYRVQHRVLVMDGAREDSWVDLSSYHGKDWTLSASIADGVEQENKTAKIRLRRRFGRFLDLSRTNTESATYDGSQQLIDLRTRIRVEYALVPVEWTVQGWEWAPAFDGFVESMDWGADVLEIDALDLSAALNDVFRVDARRYEYGRASTTLSSAHLQTLINDNVPKTIRPGETGGFYTWGYLGGTPLVYTPVTDQWIQRYEHGGTGTVLKLLQGVSDQIGWDVRYRPYHPLSEERLTYSEPPRNLSQPLSDIRVDSQGRTAIAFAFPHGLQVGQTVTISDVAGFSTTGYVYAVPAWDRIIVNAEPVGGPSPATSGNVEHGPHFTLSAANVFAVQRANINISDIRNHIIIKYNRTESAATFFVSSMYDDGADGLTVELPGDADVSVLEVGQEATISAATPSGWNGTRAISAINGNAVLLVPAGVVGSTSSGVFSSDYLAFNQYVAVNTPSIQKYGLRSAGVFEGSIEGIDTYEEAARLGRGMISDMANPTIDMSIETTCLPHTDLHDLLGLEEDPLGRWSGTINVAVVGYAHEFGPVSTTKLELRHDHPSKGRAWLNRGRGLTLDVPGNWGIPNANINIGYDVDFGFDFSSDVGPFFMSAWQHTRGKSHWLHDKTEMHLSTGTSGFLPSESTLMDSTRGQMTSAMGNVGGRLTPGQTYYVKYRHRDKWGNVSGVHTGSTSGYVLRFLAKPPGAKALIASSNAAVYTPEIWATVFGVTSATGGYDPYSNFSSFAPPSSSTPAPVGASTANYFIMPCDGSVNAEGRIGLRYSGSKSTSQMALGLFLSNRNASVPYIYPKITLETTPATTVLLPMTENAVPGFLIGWDVKTVQYHFGDPGTPVPLATTMYLVFSETITANSGDRVELGIRAGNGTTDLYLNPTDGTVTSCTGWYKFTVVSQNPPPTGT